LAMATLAPTMTSAHPDAFGVANHIVIIAAARISV